MAPKYKAKGKEKSYPSYSDPYYPTEWSAWEWHPESRSWRRYRLKASDDYEFQYSDQSPNTPRSVTDTASTPMQQASYSSTSPGGYTTSALDRISEGVSQMTIANQPAEIPPRTLIRTRNIKTTEEQFDSNYHMQDGSEFWWGRIFKILWTEPEGSDGRGRSRGTESVRRDNKGGKSYAEVRRFVIVEHSDGHCLCLPINTYRGQGVNKPGVKARHHAPIYTDTLTYLPGEQDRGLTRKAILMEADSPRHKLLPASRLNYAKVYTVEYNVKVWFIGQVHASSRHQVAADYNDLHPPMSAGGKTTFTSSANPTGQSPGGSSSFQPQALYNSSAYGSSGFTPTAMSNQTPIGSYATTAYTTPNTGQYGAMNPSSNASGFPTTAGQYSQSSMAYDSGPSSSNQPYQDKEYYEGYPDHQRQYDTQSQYDAQRQYDAQSQYENRGDYSGKQHSQGGGSSRHHADDRGDSYREHRKPRKH